MTQIAADFVALQHHWPTILVVLGILSSMISTIATAMTPYPKIENWLHDLIGLLSWAEHWDVGGWSLPGLMLTKPSGPKGPGISGAISALACFVAVGLGACAALRPVPTQTLNCLENQAAPAAAAAGMCLATASSAASTETCFLAAGEGQGLAVLECEALAIWGDLHHANTVAAATQVPTATVQINAAKYLSAKGITVTTSN